MTGFSSFNIFLQILINGILFGGMYGVAAIGLSLIFGSLQIIFIAQGTMMILSAYFTYWAFTLTSIDPFSFQLRESSLCVDGGYDVMQLDGPRYDRDGHLRPNPKHGLDPVVDIGSDEFYK